MRNLQPGDRPELEKILIGCNAFTSAEVACALELLDNVLTDPDQQDYEVIIAEAQSRVAGYVLFGAVPLTQGNYDLYWIATDPELHGKGFGRQLMEETERRLRARGARMLCLETSSQEFYQRTRHFYVQGGYQEEARIRDFYRPGDDRITYVKRFFDSR
ncbi:GNAT family N-acetyltransferase [Pelovirga terrestris]|uniref:GNAT family N-acetyltransferase n=1 Tax=Pelovirga terrestris TaxID=2771352 RepID=A0A8J6QWN9_9BACT|nr:GNAT family N-acetyltransferase [Pelovirga terrestris]MBD1399252.1 GNAT family N-acetyltransferase [Pelovirga terrestris]